MNKSNMKQANKRQVNDTIEPSHLGLFSTIGLNVLMISYLISILNLGLGYINRHHDATRLCASYGMSLKTIQKIGNEYKIDCFFKK